MKQFLIIFLLLPLFVYSQTQPKPKPKPATKPATTTKKPATTAKKPTTTTKKPVTTTKPAGPKKPNPQVLKLTEKAYEYYRASKDVECEKTIKQILALDPKNRDAYLLRANIAMFAEKKDEMWKNLDKLYKMYPKEPEVYSQFAMTHLNYYFLSDSMKRVLCRKTIKLASRNAEGYASLGMVAAVGGFYQEAIDYFDISFNKFWKDTTSKVIINLPYARCLYETGDTIGAIKKLDNLIPRMGGNDKYTCVFLRAKYKLDMGNTDIQADIDTLNNFAPNQGEIMILNAKYLGKTNRKDSACKMAKMVRMLEGGESFDMSEFCDDLQKTVDLEKNKSLTYAIGTDEFLVVIDQFNYNGGIKFSWSRGNPFTKAKHDHGKIMITKTALDSAHFQSNFFDNETDITLDKTITLWLSKQQFEEIQKDSTTKIAPTNAALGTYKLVGHEQLEVFNSENKEVLLDCIVLSDGSNKICYVNDASNPLIVKMELEAFTIFLTKIE
jgi:tetratricopeptide (TPR) repeat protein